MWQVYSLLIIAVYYKFCVSKKHKTMCTLYVQSLTDRIKKLCKKHNEPTTMSMSGPSV